MQQVGARGYAKKKDLKAAVGKPLRFIETSPFGGDIDLNSTVVVVGPDAFTKRDWYANVTLKDGIIVKVV